VHEEEVGESLHESANPFCAISCQSISRILSSLHSYQEE
uniref:Uncharacterized protein n=1 Tax=Amphimedon queenslandica TaxID=400682 RepID=A0A1X7VMB3_AMPQE